MWLNDRFKTCGVLCGVVLLINVTSTSAPVSDPDTPVDDAEYAQILEYYSYDPDLPLEVEVSREWPWRAPHVIYRVTFRSVREQRVPAYLAIPKERKADRLPAVILLHGANQFWGKNGDWAFPWISILTASGRAVLVPDHFLFGERAPETDLKYDFLRGNPYTLRDWITQDVVDIRRAIDYLQSRHDIDPERIGILGGSLGGWTGSIAAAVDGRIKAAALGAPACHVATAQTPAGRIANALNFFPRLGRTSLLVFLGKKDNPKLNGRARLLFKLAPGKKKLIEYDDGHFLAAQKYYKDILAWFDEHL